MRHSFAGFLFAATFLGASSLAIPQAAHAEDIYDPWGGGSSILYVARFDDGQYAVWFNGTQSCQTVKWGDPIDLVNQEYFFFGEGGHDKMIEWAEGMPWLCGWPTYPPIHTYPLYFDGGSGDDVLVGNSEGVVLLGGDGNDVLCACSLAANLEYLHGGNGWDCMQDRSADAQAFLGGNSEDGLPDSAVYPIPSVSDRYNPSTGYIEGFSKIASCGCPCQ